MVNVVLFIPPKKLSPKLGPLAPESSLIGAAEMGQFQAVKILLMDGADPCATRSSGQTAGEGAQGRFEFTGELVYNDIPQNIFHHEPAVKNNLPIL
jgi:hypothetical protein